MDIFQFKRERRSLPELNIAALLDALTVVIFFLLNAIAFTNYTIINLPAAAVVQSSSVTDKQPLSPILKVAVAGPTKLFLELSWSGTQPGQIRGVADRSANKGVSDLILSSTGNIVSEFARKFPNEKAIRVSFSGNAEYQEMITVMDGLRGVLPDIVLTAEGEANQLLNKGG